MKIAGMNAPEVEAILTYLIQADEGERVASMDLIRERIWGAVRVHVRPERAMRSADLAALVAVAPHEIEHGRWLAELGRLPRRVGHWRLAGRMPNHALESLGGPACDQERAQRDGYSWRGRPRMALPREQTLMRDAS